MKKNKIDDIKNEEVSKVSETISKDVDPSQSQRLEDDALEEVSGAVLPPKKCSICGKYMHSPDCPYYFW